jgi:intein/homing endonuclease
MSEEKEKTKKNIIFGAGEIDAAVLEANNLVKNEGEGALTFAIKNAMGSAKKNRAPRIGFTEDPIGTDHYAGVYKVKKKLLPDSVLKLVRVQNHLVASILRARANTMSMFGHIKKDRFDIGIEVSIKPEFEEHIRPDQMVKIRDRIEKFKKIIINCGHTDGLPEDEKMTLSEFLYLQTLDGLSLGRFATEIVYEDNDNGISSDLKDRAKKFHRFRPVDAGTIYKTVKKGEAAHGLRETGIKLLEQVTGKKINGVAFEKDEYAYVQVIEGMPKQAFAPDELIVHNLYPSNDIDHNGYPTTPIDTCISSITTHISIDAYNKLYFQNGRAAKGILVIKSEELDQNTLNQLKQDFMASINNVGNSFRVPVFGVGKEDEIGWTPMVSSAGDGEFQFLYDAVARNILSTFSMSPDELPGYGHLSRGTNAQTLSECFDIDSPFLSSLGYKTARQILGEKTEAPLMVWTGKKWQEGRVFKTGTKQLAQTVTTSGLTVRTSPDHRFLALGEDGSPAWVHQSDLKEGDYVLVNAQPIKGHEDFLPSFNGKKITKELLEVLGWMTGDGSLIAPRFRAGGKIVLFYHHDKEADVQQRHLNILTSFGVNAKEDNKPVSQEEQEKIKGRYGFKNVAELRRRITIYDTDFVRFLLENGFETSLNGKSIPEFLHLIPAEYKAAFLRGLFSADGHATTTGQIILTIQEDHLRNEVRGLLYELGIRSNGYKGVKRDNSRSDNLSGTQDFSHKISVRDTEKYWEMIGFVQEHKNSRRKEKKWLLDELPHSTVNLLCSTIKESEGFKLLDKAERDRLTAAIKGTINLSLNTIKKYAAKADVILPEWISEYNVEKIESAIILDESCEMVDVEVFDDEHAFILNGFVVHNSSNEFKLTAARDTGLRPLILQFQSFLNEKLFQIIDPELAQLCTIKLSGLDAQSRDQETNRLQQAMPIHMDYDQVLTDVEKKPVGERMAGKVPFNEHWQIIADKYIDVAEIMAEFMKSPAALADPLLKYKRDPFWIQNMQILMQINPAAVKAYYATKPYAIEILKMMIEDYLEEDSERK